MQRVKNVHWVIAAVFLQSLSFLSIKYASTGSSYMYFFLGLATVAIFFRSVLWQKVLSQNELSSVYPFNALVQLLIFFYAVVLFNESFTWVNIVGLVVMSVGIMMLGKKEA